MKNTENKTDVVTGLSSIYDLGFDHCITIVKGFLSHMPGISDTLIKKLEQLKDK